ncbi:MAG: hypothetical protein AAF416_09495 [Pseudomonadota bacterium]
MSARAAVIVAALAVAGCAADRAGGPVPSVGVTASAGSSGGGIGAVATTSPNVVIYRASRDPLAGRRRVSVASAAQGSAFADRSFEERARREPRYEIAPSGAEDRAATRARAVARQAAERQAQIDTARTARDFDEIDVREDITVEQLRTRRALAEARLRREGVLEDSRRRALARQASRPNLAPSLAERTDALQQSLAARGRPDFSRPGTRTRIRSSMPTYNYALPE